MSNPIAGHGKCHPQGQGSQVGLHKYKKLYPETITHWGHYTANFLWDTLSLCSKASHRAFRSLVSASLSSRQSLAPFPPPCPHLCASSPICFSVSSLCIPTTPGSEQKIFKPHCLFLTAPLPSKSQGAKPSHPT